MGWRETTAKRKPLPYSQRCRAYQHWACRGRRGHGRGAASMLACECRCHTDSRVSYEVDMTPGEARAIASGRGVLIPRERWRVVVEEGRS